jgi:hypothetical protein
MSDNTKLALLQASLGAAVPLWIEQWRGRSYEERAERVKELGGIVAHEGDNILFRSKKKGGTSRAFNALAESVAIMSFQPGGIKLFGLHFETKE